MLVQHFQPHGRRFTNFNTTTTATTTTAAAAAATTTTTTTTTTNSHIALYYVNIYVLAALYITSKNNIVASN